MHLSIRLFFVICSLGFVDQALAQSAFVPEENNIPAHLNEALRSRSLFENQSAIVLNATDSYLPVHLQKSLQSFQDQKQVACEDSKNIDYAISLTIKGDYQSCFDYAKTCLNETHEKTPIPLIIQGARCAALDYQYENAYQLFKNGLQSDEFKGDLASAYLIEYASLALYSNYADEVQAIINLHPTWNSEQKNLAQGLIEYMGAGLPQVVTKKQVFEFVDQQLSQATGFYSQLLMSIRISNDLKDYQFQKAYDDLVKDAVHFTNPLDWWRTGFNTLYAISDGLDYTASRNFYLAFLPYAHARLITLPTERNVYNYTDIYSKICKNEMLQEPLKSEFVQQLNLWRQGKISLNDLIADLKTRPPEFLNKSDVMSTLGSLLSIQGQYAEAQQAYWKSHQLCAYNNRAHWGFILLERRKKYLSFPEFDANEKFVESTLQNISFPSEIQKFIPNYSSFPEVSQKRIQYAARIWAPYIQGMFSSGHLVYIKLPFELLSEVPGFSDLRNARIGPPAMPNYLFDNRLWDDVRGAGGETVAADHDEVFQTVHGDYNLLGHEMTHQFQRYIQSARPELDTCINQLYSNAKKRDVFSDGYAKSSVAEYFAQGVTYYLIPASFPARYGTNISWSQKNDPDLFQFMLSIDQAGGDLKKIKCPVTP